MNRDSRTKNVLRNIVGGIGAQLFTTVLSFVCRTIFIKLLGATYLGVNGLFSNILSMLSLAELGIGSAIVFSMYKPIAENDERHVAKLMNFYRTAYRIIAVAVAVCGLALTPFLEVLIKEDTSQIHDLKLIYLLILSNTAVSYLVAYKGAMLNADQKNYVAVIIKNIFAVIQNGLQIVVLIVFNSFIAYLIVQIITTLMTNVVQAVYVNQKYPFLVAYKKERIDTVERKSILKNVRGMMMHKIGGFVLNGTDNLIISGLVGVVSVGLYSNYLMIITIVRSYITQITGATTASVGNLIAKETSQKSYEIFKIIFFAYNGIYSFCFVSFYVLFQPFIEWWIGKEYLLSDAVVFIVLINFYLNGMQGCINNFTNATGLFWETRYKPVIECTVNLGVSIWLAKSIGLPGVFIGTLASFLATFWINPKLVYRKQFNRSSWSYLLRFGLYSAITVGSALGLRYVLDALLREATIWTLLIRAVFCVITPMAVLAALFKNTEEYNYSKRLIESIIQTACRKVSRKKG